MSVVVLESATPTARTEHRCNNCGRTIAPGETYHRQSNVYEDRAYTWKSCQHCEATAQLLDLYSWADDYGVGPDNFVNHDPETWAEARLCVLWRKQWRRKDGTLYPIPGKEGESDA